MDIKIKLPNKQQRTFEVADPLPPLHTFRENWMRHHVDQRKLFDTNFFPCLHPECCGNGRIYDPNDQPDPVEGNKMRDRIKCPTCKGSGQTTKKEFLEFYNISKKMRNQRRKFEKETAKKIQAALNKISAEDFETIRYFLR